MPQSPFMMILGLSKNPKDFDIVLFFFQEVMKSLGAGCELHTEGRGVKHSVVEERTRLPELFSQVATGAHSIDYRIRT